MSDRDDNAELFASARTVTKTSAFLFNGRIRYENKGERLLCLDPIRIYICSVKIPVKIEYQINILTIKIIDRINDSHVMIEADEKQCYSFQSLNEKTSLQPFLLVLIRNLHAVFPHRLSSIIDVRPDNEYDRLIRQINETSGELNVTSTIYRPCGGYSLRYECACDLYQIPFHRTFPHIVETVFAHRISREFTFREMEGYPQKEWLPMLTALRHNDWFRKLTIENVKLSTENSEEICNVVRVSNGIQELKLVGCGLKHEFCSKLAANFGVSHVEHLDLSQNPLEDKGINALSTTLSQRKYPLKSICLQSCSITHKSLYAFHTGLTTNPMILKHLQILNLTGNRIKEENCLTLLFSNSENVLEELQLSDVEFPLESFFHSLATLSCKLRRFYIWSTKTTGPASISGGVKLFFSKNSTLELLQISNANLSNDFLRELCDGLQSNNRLTQLDLRLQGNPLESFLRDNSSRLASIPSLIALDITACDADNELATLLNELKKNSKLKTLYLPKNLNNIKSKNFPRTIVALKDLILENNLEILSLADCRLKENSAEILVAAIGNTSLKTLDLRGNSIGDTGVRILARLLRINRHLKTIYFDRNFISLNNFEEIVEAMDENSVIEYLPVPIFDIVAMKTTEKERIEKLQQLMNKLDSICQRNQQAKETIFSPDSLNIIPTGFLTREMNSSWETSQQLIGGQASLEFLTSKIDDVSTNVTRTHRIAQLNEQLNELFLAEENLWRENLENLTRKFDEYFRERNERLAKKVSQFYKEKVQMPIDEKFQNEIRHFLRQTNDQVEDLMKIELDVRLKNRTRQNFVDLVTSLQKRAYEINAENAVEAQKLLESATFPSVNESPSQSHSSTLDRLVSKGTNVINRLAHKHTPTLNEPTTEDSGATRGLRKADSTECLEERSPKPPRGPTKETRLLSSNPSKTTAPTSPKPPVANWRRSTLEVDVPLKPLESVYSNAPFVSGSKTNEVSSPVEDDGDSIANDLLNIVQQEEKKDRQRSGSATQEQHHLDIEVETTAKLVHPGKDRPRRANVSRPARRGTNGGISHDSSSDGGLDIDEPIETPTNEDSQPVTKSLKSALKPAESSGIPPPVPAKLQSRPSVPLPTAPKPMESVSLTNSDAPTNDNSSNRMSMMPNSSLNFHSIPKDDNHPTPPPVSARPSKAAIGTRVLPVGGSNGDAPPIRLRHLPTNTDKKVEEKPPIPEPSCAEPAATPNDQSDDFKRMSVKERARLLATSNTPIPTGEKKLTTQTSNQTIF